MISVKDTGIGIKQEDIQKLFSRFERIEEKRNRSIEGTGLGMNITQMLLEMMGSRLEVESTYNEGSQFSFSIRQEVVKWEPIGDYEATWKQSVRSMSDYKERFVAPDAEILVVDDNSLNLMVFVSLLKQTRIKIDEASSGDEGIALALKKHYDIIFLDHITITLPSRSIQMSLKISLSVICRRIRSWQSMMVKEGVFHLCRKAIL